MELLTKPIEEHEAAPGRLRGSGAPRRMLHRRAELGALAARYALLTFREREVMSLVVAELANKQIAGRLGITEMTSDPPRQGDAEDASLPELVRMAERLFPGRDESLD